jgi:hypothetical protein
MNTKKKNNYKSQSSQLVPVISSGMSEYEHDIRYFQSIGYSRSEAIRFVNSSGKYII